jgi:hypothetical protein
MGSLLFFDLVYALGVAISPTPVILVILMLFGVRGQLNALGYLIGWIVGLVLLGIVIYGLVAAGIILLSSNTGFVRPIVQALLGVLVLFLAYRRWNKPIDPNASDAGPKWLGSVDKMLAKSDNVITPFRAFLLAIVMSAISPKNIALMIAAVLAFSQFELQAQDIVVLFAVFIVISSLTIGIPVGYALLKGDKAGESLTQWKLWVLRNSPRAVALLMAMIGVVLIFNGLSGMTMNLPS